MSAEILQIIDSQVPLPFARFMEIALYHPEQGYYTRTDRLRIGRRGDFFTSVSVGPLFGRLLLQRLHDFWNELGRPAAFHLLEPGPEGGQLALDILAAARTDHPEFHAAIRYHACEPVAAKREILQSRFAAAGEPKARPVASAKEVQGRCGAIIANEILDALPVHIVRFQNGQWTEQRVTVVDETLAWIDHPVATPGLAESLAALGGGFPDGYTTEACLEHEAFLTPLATAFDQSLSILIDYGFSRAELYLPSRSDGTLRTYHQHQAGDMPLDRPGQQDITAHVDFTSLLHTGRRLGLSPVGFTRQERYLTALAEPILHAHDPADDDTTTLARQFQTLTHPAMLGAKFHILEFTKNAPPPTPNPFRFDPRGLAYLDGTF